MSRASCIESGDKMTYASESSASAALDYMIKCGAMLPTADIYQCRHCGNWHMTSVLERGNRSIRGASSSAKNSKIVRLVGGKRQRRKKPMRKMRKS